MYSSKFFMMPYNNIFESILFLFHKIFNTLFLNISMDLISDISKIFDSLTNLNSFIVLFLYNKKIINIQPRIIKIDTLFKLNKILKETEKENHEIKNQPKQFI